MRPVLPGPGSSFAPRVEMMLSPRQMLLKNTPGKQNFPAVTPEFAIQLPDYNQLPTELAYKKDTAS